MDKPILITKKDCDKCDWLKDKINKENLDVDIFDAKSKEGMAHLTYHELWNTGEIVPMPVLIIDDDNIIKGEAIRMLKVLKENNGKQIFEQKEKYSNV